MSNNPIRDLAEALVKLSQIEKDLAVVKSLVGGAANDILDEESKAKDDRRRVWQVDTSLPMDLDAAPELRNWGRRAYYETGLADNDWRLLYSDEQS